MSNAGEFVTVTNREIFVELQSLRRKVDYLLLSNTATWLVLAWIAKKVFF